ncbi:MAG: hypothetical protein IT312_16395 [Anaerolineales bacterium]|nr:hypothetical protein [Anaerolineales bacterium]
MFELTPSWRSSFPAAHAGILVMRNVSNPAHHAELEKRKAELEKRLRAKFAGQDRAALARMSQVTVTLNVTVTFL